LPSQELSKLLVGDVLIGTSVTFCVAPFVAMVDQAIVQRSAGTHTIIASVQSTMGQMFRHPAAYFRSTPFLWMWALYAATYSTANSLKTLQENVHGNNYRTTHVTAQNSVVLCISPSTCAFTPTLVEDYKDSNDMEVASGSNNSNQNSKTFTVERSISWFSGAASTLLASSLGLLVGTSTVNMSMSLLKDRAYARMFGNQQTIPNSAKPLAVPKLSYAMWMTRDFMVVGSSFLLPDMVVQNLLKNGYIDPAQTNATLRGAQFLIPVASQLVAGPIHLLGLNVYHRPELAPLESLRSLQHGAVVSVIAARMARILPGYSVGGVGNTFLRDRWRHWIRTP
jgi:hypothetical protein